MDQPVVQIEITAAFMDVQIGEVPSAARFEDILLPWRLSPNPFPVISTVLILITQGYW